MIKNGHPRRCFLIVLFYLAVSLAVIAQNNPTLIHTSADFGMKCDGNTDDTQRFMNAIGTGQGSQNLYIIFVNGTCNIKWVNPITVPSYVTLDFTQQGALFLASGSTLNINSAIVDQDYHPIFTGTGTYNISPRNAVTCTAITGGTACQATGAGGLPGNPANSVQFNNSGMFGGTTVSVGQTIIGTSGSPVGRAYPYLDVRDYGNGTTNSIASAITAAGASNQAVIISPQQYAITEAVPGSVPTGNGGSGATTSNNIWIRDWRNGEYDTTVDFLGHNPSSNLRAWKQWISNYQASIPLSPTGINLTTLITDQKGYFGGFNQNNGTYANKTNWAPFQWNINGWTPGQHILHTNTINNYSIGDSLAILNQVSCAGGFNAQGDEGCEAVDNEITQLANPVTGTIASGASTGATSLTLSIAAGSGTQGQGRYLLDVTQDITTGTISSISNASPPVVTGSSTAWPVSTVNTTIGTAVTAPGSATVTPASMTGISTATLLCIADANNFEMLFPSSTTGTTFTATFTKAHLSSAIVASGGLCGYGMELTGDRITEVGVLKLVYPVIVSTSSTAATLWVSSQNGFGQYIGNFKSGTRNGYVAYPEAEVVSVASGGTVSSTVTLGPNSVAWSNGDSIEEPLYPAVHVTLGNNSFSKFFPSPSNQASLAHQDSLNGLWIGNNGESLYSATNNTPNGYYDASFNGTGTLGNFQPPHYTSVNGPWLDYLLINGPEMPAQGVIDASITTSGTLKMITTKNAVSGHDEFDYLTGSGQWLITSNSAANNYIFDGTGFYENNGTSPVGKATFPFTNLFVNQTTVQDSGPFGSNEINSPVACETSFGATTLNTGGTTTNTGLNCLPANAIIDAVVYRVTTTINTAVSFTIGDSTTAARFCSTQSGVVAGSTGTCIVQWTSATAGTMGQATAASVRVTMNANPTTGAIRIIVYAHTFTPPTS